MRQKGQQEIHAAHQKPSVSKKKNSRFLSTGPLILTHLVSPLTYIFQCHLYVVMPTDEAERTAGDPHSSPQAGPPELPAVRRPARLTSGACSQRFGTDRCRVTSEGARPAGRVSAESCLAR